jgi:hypothetical protein
MLSSPGSGELLCFAFDNTPILHAEFSIKIVRVNLSRFVSFLFASLDPRLLTSHRSWELKTDD